MFTASASACSWARSVRWAVFLRIRWMCRGWRSSSSPSSWASQIPSRAKQYLDRPKTAYEHAWEIRTKRGYHLFEEPDADVQFQRFLDARTWTQAEGPVALFEHCVIWLHTEPGEDRFHRVVLTSWLLDTLAPHLLRLSGLPGADLLAGIPHARARNRPRSTPPERRSIACTMRRRRRPPKSRQ